jgi:hypothetical protein
MNKLVFKIVKVGYFFVPQIYETTGKIAVINDV